MPNPSKEKVYIIIPAYNRKEMTIACLETLKKTGDLQRYYIVVVDDGSTDGTGAAIHDLYPEVIILPGNGDLWWTGAIAYGMQYAYEQGAECFFWLNDDCVPEADALPLLVQFMRQHPDTIVAPGCYQLENQTPVIVQNGCRDRKNFAAQPGTVIPVDIISGWCVGIPASVYRKIGVPDIKRFPHYHGDDTYILRATKAGFKACLVGDAKVILLGFVNWKHNLSSYFKPGLSPSATFRALFWNKKSKYRLPTQFFYHTEKYGIFLGSLFFLVKLSSWLIQWYKLQFSSGKTGVSP